ncbi:hypothetical protein C0U41_29845, partial [Klebsiella pneumoniae]
SSRRQAAPLIGNVELAAFGEIIVTRVGSTRWKARSSRRQAAPLIGNVELAAFGEIIVTRVGSTRWK